MELEVDSEDEEDPLNEKIARAVLLFCAVVVVGVAAYTTFQLFSKYDIDISLSPPDAARFSPPGEDEVVGTASFDMKKEQDSGEGKKVFEDKLIEPYEGGGIMRSPLIISENIDKDGGGRLVFIVIALEVVVIFLIYRKLDKKFFG
jgi:hypothetical protein